MAARCKSKQPPSLENNFKVKIIFFLLKMDKELPLNVKIKQEKLTPEREDADTDPDDEIDRFLNSKPFGSDEIDDKNKKNVEPAK